jgi:dephospho-CoA kinase
LSEMSGGKMIIAVKGLIGSGKSTISNYLVEKYEFTLVNCDKIVHELYENDENIRKEICDTFKLEVFDRQELGKIVFADPVELSKLESIVHPILKETCNKLIENNENIVIDCQIIDKLGIEYDLGLIAVASEATIVKRVMARDNRNEEQILDILKHQTRVHFLKVRSYAIDTEVEYEDMIDKVIRSYNASKNWKDC